MKEIKGEWEQLKKDVLNSNKKEFTIKRDDFLNLIDRMIVVEKVLINFTTHNR